MDHAVLDPLRRGGFSVTTAQSEGNNGADDDAQLAYAAERNLVIVSHNQRHFRRWHRIFEEHGRSHGGIILIPAGSPEPQLTVRVAMMADWLRTFPTYESRLFRWTELQCLLTQGYRLAGYADLDLRLALGQQPAT